MGRPRANFRSFLLALKRDGFHVTSDGQCDHERICMLEKELPDRTLTLQLWGDGRHRVSHMAQGSVNTYPTDFTDLASMAGAIKHETERGDNYKISGAVPSGIRPSPSRTSPMTSPDEVSLVEKGWNGPYEVVGSIYEGMMATVCEASVGRSIAQCREYQDAVLIADALNATATPLVKMREALEFIGGHDAAANGLSGFAFELVEQLTSAARAALSSNLEGG